MPNKSFFFILLPLITISFAEVGGGLIPKTSDLIFELTLEKIKKGFRFITLEEKTCGKNDKTRSKDKVTFDYEQRLPDGKYFIHNPIYQDKI